MVVTVAGIFIDVSPEQRAKAPSSIDVTEFGMSIEVSPIQSQYLQLVVYQLIYNKTVEK